MKRIEAGLLFGSGEFEFSESPYGNDAEFAYEYSSRTKRVYRGTYHKRVADDGDVGVPAVAVFCERYNDTCLAREMAALGAGARDGFGPVLLAHAEATLPGEKSRQTQYVAIEEDAGVSLDKILDGHEIPGRGDLPSHGLYPAGTLEGDRQSAKILFDIFCQVRNMHQHGNYHHDIKSANVCLRSIGDDPWDIRATIVDFDHAMSAVDSRYVSSTPAYYTLLFERLPGKKVENPTSMQRDLGCLSVVQCEVLHRTALGYSKADDEFTLTPAQLFSVIKKGGIFYYKEGEPCAREIDKRSDLNRLAKAAALYDANDYHIPAAIRRDATLFKCGAYLDKENIRQLKEQHEKNLGDLADDIARMIFENYNAHYKEEHGRNRFPAFDDQPNDLRESNYAQAAYFATFIWRLGCEIVSDATCPESELISCFSDEEVGKLARWEHERWFAEKRQMGYRYGRTHDGCSDSERRISPSLIPYDQLEDANKDKNKQIMRDMLDILRAFHLGIRKRIQ